MHVRVRPCSHINCADGQSCVHVHVLYAVRVCVFNSVLRLRAPCMPVCVLVSTSRVTHSTEAKYVWMLLFVYSARSFCVAVIPTLIHLRMAQGGFFGPPKK